MKLLRTFWEGKTQKIKFVRFQPLPWWMFHKYCQVTNDTLYVHAYFIETPFNGAFWSQYQSSFRQLAYLLVKETFRMNNKSMVAVFFFFLVFSFQQTALLIWMGASRPLPSSSCLKFNLVPRRGPRNEGASHVTSLCPILFHLYALKQRMKWYN